MATPTLGPSAVLAWRRLAGTLLHRPDGFTLEDIGAGAIGQGESYRYAWAIGNRARGD